jgi:O-methyltransferase involved in polyketide biosynthesis
MSLLQTNDDATAARNSAAKKGYIKDEYVSLFTKKLKSCPLINKGTALRTLAINYMINKYSQEHKKIQIVSLGAGFDTRYFTLDIDYIDYWEIDFPQVVQKKITIIQKSLSQKFDFTVENGNLRSAHYHIIGADLRHFTQECLGEWGIDSKIPTLVLSECCLIYLQVETSNSLIKDFYTYFENCGFLVYEQICPLDQFGKMMIQNLEERGITLYGITQYPSLDSQIQRFKTLGFSQISGWDMLDAYKECIPQDTIDLWNSIERLDEIEEWNLFCRHYFLLMAIK